MSEQGEHACACGGSCGCGGGGHAETQRVYLTRDEYIVRLEQYLVQLRAEIDSVEQELSDLRQTA